MHRLLLAIEDSESSIKAVDYVVGMFAAGFSGKVSLVSVVRNLSPDSQELKAFYGEADLPELHGDIGHIGELKSAKSFSDKVVSKMIEGGVPAESLSTMLLPDRRGVAQDLIDEARKSGCQTIVVGRREDGHLHHLLLGSVSTSLVEKASGLTVWVVG